MAYDSRQGRYQDVQYDPRAREYGRNYDQHAQGQYGYSNGGRYDQYDHGYEDHQQNAYDYSNQYSQSYEPAWDQRGYQDQYHDHMNGYSETHPQQQPAQQSRQYHYDDRFANSGRSAAKGHDARSRQAGGRRSPPASRPGTSASHRKHKQERILDSTGFDAPKAMAWDNPFGVFPGTKKDVEKKRKEAEEARSRSRADNPVERPSTASSSRVNPNDQGRNPKSTAKQSFEETQSPHTSHGARSRPTPGSSGSFNQPLGPLDDMPPRKKQPPLPGPSQGAHPLPQQMPHNAAAGSFDLSVRSAPQRSASGPDPYHQQQYSQPVNEPRNVPAASGRFYDTRPQQQLPAQYGNEQLVEHNIDNRPERSEVWASPEPMRTNGSHPQDLPKGRGELPYRGVGPTAPASTLPEHGMPNFAAMAPGATENVEKEVTLQTQPAAVYRKPTYGDASSRPPPIRPGLIETSTQPGSSQAQVQSPLDDFDFELPRNDLSQSARAANNQQRQPVMAYDRTAEQRQYQTSNENPYGQSQSHHQYPPRNTNRSGMPHELPADAFSHPYNQPPGGQQGGSVRMAPPARPPLVDQDSGRYNMPPRGDHGVNQQGYSQDPYAGQYSQGQGYPQNAYEDGQYQQKPLSRTFTEPTYQYRDGGYGDHYNHGYDQRDRSRPTQDYGPDSYRADPYNAPHNYQNQGYDQNSAPIPARPRTANSARPPAGQYPDQPMPTSRPPQSGLPAADRNHPVPVRPGLMAPAPAATPAPAPTPMSQAPPPQGARQPGPPQAASPPPKKAVTTAELNEYRNAYKERPNDDKLGLKFAKRLVEAAVVLADEGGKADPKTTTKNRERYINDAYRIVKRLVANGSPDGMFYLADCYGQGQLGLEANPKEAFHLYTSAAKLGHAQSAYRVAVCCELGPDGGGGTRRDHVKAVQFYKRAATLGDGPAMFKMGMILLKGLLGQAENRREAISWLKRAAERADEENPHALHELGVLYEHAQNTDVILRDEAYALQLFTQGANLGYKYSQHRLGSAYEYGTLGCQIDPRQSIAWYSRAAQQGEHQSEFALSGWYLTGSEPLLAQSDTEAYLWARKAAQSGLAKAEYAMGYYTEVGIGCQPNLEEAKKWYFRAAAQMDNRAKERLEEIKRGGKRKEKTRISRSHVGRQNEGECNVM